MDLKSIIKTWKEVFGNWKYLLIGLIIATFFYFLNVLIAGWRSLAGFYLANGFLKSLNFLWVLFIGFRETLTNSSFIGLVVISILLGMLFTLLIYKAHFNMTSSDKELGMFGGMGAFLAAFVPGCAACGVGIASAFGIGAGALAFLPYDGIELSLLAVIILGITIFKTTKNLYICKVPEILNNRVQTQLKGGKKK